MDEPDQNNWMSIDEVLDHIMHVEKCSRRKAKRLLVSVARQGKLRAIGINVETDEYEQIPPEAWSDQALK